MAPGEGQYVEGEAFRGLLLQLALRVLMVAFIFFAFLLHPPLISRWPYELLWLGYIVVIACWSFWALRPANRAGVETRRSIAVLMLCADLAVVSILSAE